jgi:hypothetical protein
VAVRGIDATVAYRSLRRHCTADFSSARQCRSVGNIDTTQTQTHTQNTTAMKAALALALLLALACAAAPRAAASLFDDTVAAIPKSCHAVQDK